MGAVVFLPAFLIGMELELLVLGKLGDNDLLRIIGDQLFMFIALVIPVVLASVIFSLCSIIVPSRWREHSRLTAVLLSLALVSSSVFVGTGILNIGLLSLLLAFFPASIGAAVLYGLVAKVD